MRLVTFERKGGEPRVGTVTAGGIIDIATHIPEAPHDMLSLIAQWDEWRAPIEALLKNTPADVTLDVVTLLSPVPRPGKIMAIGLNYADHVAESGMEKPGDQLWFAKMSTSVTGPYSDVELPRVSDKLDYEAELAVVIGRRCRHVAQEDATSVVFGYCVANDISVRDWQLRTSQFTLGKSFDTHAPLGPWIVTKEDVTDVHQLGVRLFVNGEKRQSSSTDQLIFDIPAQIAHLSQVMTLEPGDVLLTGTPGGVGAAHKPPIWLRDGDIVRVEIDEIGAIVNRIVNER
ncbi:fumarylacetoacetate hydrolase family protein [Cupriavidus necator]